MTPLPPLLVLTDGPRVETGGRELQDVLAAVIDAGGPDVGVIVRERHLNPDARAELVAWTEGAASAGGTLVIAASPATAPGQAVHLTAVEPVPRSRPPLTGRSCHDAADLEAAVAEGSDYATLSPVYLTDSKPGYGPALGPGALADAPLPVYALGGVVPDNALACREAGAVGVAVMGAVMRSDDPARTVRDLLDAFGGQ